MVASDFWKKTVRMGKAVYFNDLLHRLSTALKIVDEGINRLGGITAMGEMERLAFIPLYPWRNFTIVDEKI